MNQPEITKMMTISTTHINQKSNEFLDDRCDEIEEGFIPYVPLTVLEKHGYGWIIYIDKEEIDDKQIPTDIKDCMYYALDHDCDILCLDCDGPIVDDLPKYKWQ